MGVTSEQDRRKKRDYYLRRTYGLSLSDYEGLLAQQGGVCAICGRSPGARALHVDHDHKSNYVRGLLCHKCNRGLVWFKDQIDLFKAAIRYLRLTPAQEYFAANYGTEPPLAPERKVKKRGRKRRKRRVSKATGGKP